ncbi:MAG: LON peptidase substrate-binding domain-containing protein, partial [Thermoleophilia bacterium]|nr:LON peptidase substrate-binding domain-containing protein [Thermoleophilia bacterium]
MTELELGDSGSGPSIEIVSDEELESAIRSTEGVPLPDSMPILPLREIVTYPGTLTPLAVGQERSIRLIDEVLSGDRALAMVTSREPDVDEPGPGQLHLVGVAGVVARMMKVPDQ